MNRQEPNGPILVKDNSTCTNLNMSQNGFFTVKFNTTIKGRKCNAIGDFFNMGGGTDDDR